MFQFKLNYFCPLKRDFTKNRKFTLTIYQRNINRKLINLNETLSMLFSDSVQANKLSYKNWNVQVIMHDSNRSPCLLRQLLRNTNVLLTPHGFQTMLLLLMPNPNNIWLYNDNQIPPLIFEIYPFRYFWHYGAMTKELGYNII